MGEANVGPVEYRQGMEADRGGNASQVAGKEDEPERNTLPLGLQPGIPETQEHGKGNDRDWNQTRMKRRCNVQSADHQHGFQRKNCGQEIEPPKKMAGQDKKKR